MPGPGDFYDVEHAGDVRLNGEVIGHITDGSFIFRKPSSIGLSELSTASVRSMFHEINALQANGGGPVSLTGQVRVKPGVTGDDWFLTPAANRIRAVGWQDLWTGAYRQAFLRQIRSRRSPAERGTR